MTPLRPGIRRLFRLDRFSHEDTSRELRDEMELHVAMRAEQLVQSGMSQDDAETEARRLFALNESTIVELHNIAFDRSRRMQLRERIDAVWQDARYAARRLIREPVISAFIVGILALGIGINVAAFGVVDRVLLRGPQFVRDPQQLVRLYSRVTRPSTGTRTMPWLQQSTVEVLGNQLHSAVGMAAYRIDNTMIGSGATSETRRVSLMGAEMFGLLGVQPVKGRFYSAAESTDNVAVLSERYWRSSLSSDPDVLGKSITIENVAHTIVGIAPLGFTGPEFRRVDMWTPINLVQRNTLNFQVIARLRPGVSADALARELTQHRSDIESALPKFAGFLRGAEYLVAPLTYDATAQVPVESVLARWLAAISSLILLASCANVGNLLLARLARRRRELAVRVALGAGRSRVIRLLALEGMWLAVAAALLAFIVISLVEPIVQGALFPDGSWAFSLVDVRTLGAVFVFTLLTGALVSVVPAIQAGRRNVSDMLRSGNRAGELRSPLRSGLTIVQAMLSVVLLVGAGLFLRSVQRVNAIDLGMQPDRVLMVDLRYPRIPQNAGESLSQWGERLFAIERARYRLLVDIAGRVAGVEKAAVSIGVPYFEENTTGGIWMPSGDSISGMAEGGLYVTAADANYFATMGTPIRRGRAFTIADREGSEPVVVVGEAMAKMLWPGSDALDKCVIVGRRESTCARVVGIAADVRRKGLRQDPPMQFYVPLGQEQGFGGSSLLVRPEGAVSTSWPELRQALLQSDATIQSIDVRALSQGLDGETRPLHLGILAFGLSAALALIVAGLGLYSIMAHAVAWRRHEIGVRLALGSRPRSIASLIVQRGAMLAAIGIVLGLVVAIGARSWIEPLLFKTSATDPVVYIAVIAIVQSLALLAGWLPAQRAVSVSPTEALRAE